MSYDANGNLEDGRGRPFFWDADNKPSAITMGGATTRFVYGGSTERLKKVSPSGTSVYPFGDDYEITNGTATKYISAEGLGVIAKRVGATAYWLHGDRLGSIQAVTDPVGAEVLRRSFRPFGERIASSSSHAESQSWIDQRTDEQTDLTYLHARYYDPALGIFISGDPSHPEEPGVGLDRYRYASSDPVNRLDRLIVG